MYEPVDLIDIIRQTPGITAVIGGGGKSTFLAHVGRGLAERGLRTVLATSTHMFPASGVPFLADAEPGALLSQTGVLEESTGKLTAPREPWEKLTERADHVLVEADGSRGKPFKAHDEREPQIPAACARVVYIVGAHGFGLPIYDVVHRPQLFCQLTGAAQSDLATPELIAAGIVSEGLVGLPGDLVVVNQTETDEAREQAEALARALAPAIGCPIIAGSLREDALYRLT